jgi:S-formylglutathione hydrolase
LARCAPNAHAPPTLLHVAQVLHAHTEALRERLERPSSLARSAWMAPPSVSGPPRRPSRNFRTERGQYWEGFVAERFVTQLRIRFQYNGSLALAGISMGGYGALKLALARPADYAGVAAISPMLEPAFEASQVPLRNRYHYPPDVPQALLGPARDAALYDRDHPVLRARRNAGALRSCGLPIYLDAASRDALHAHDGAEHLHRVLWQLDVPHEYRLRRDADHIGPDILDRLRDAFAWIGARVCPPPTLPLTAAEAEWLAWLDGDRRQPPPAAAPPAPSSALFPRWLRAQLALLRDAAAAREPSSFDRCYGRLPAD